MTLIQRFQQFIAAQHLFAANDQLLLAVSGGVDSVVLCELCHQAGYNFTVVHCNFRLRGEESESDKAFVQQLADKYGVSFLLKEFDTEQYAAAHKLSIQEAARKLRYEWFEEVRSREAGVGSRESGAGSQEAGVGSQELQDGSDFRPLTPDSRLPTHIVTAHHLDDNIETMLMHFFRGTGVHGLRGMLPKQGHIVRPLLFARKEELKQFAEANHLPWVEDSSNILDKYSRNYFRHQVIPLVQKIYPEAEQNLADNLRRFADMEVLYEQAMSVHKKKLLEKKGAEVHIPVLKLKKASPLHSIVYEIIKAFGFSAQQTGEVIRLLDSDTGKYVQSATHRVIKNRKWLVITPVQETLSQTILIEEGVGSVHPIAIGFAVGNLQLAVLPTRHLPTGQAGLPLPTTPDTACLDARLISFPLILRPWKKGDYFYPLGMKKKKKLARFFIDQKLSLADKEKVWVLEMDKKIVWVIGLRIDDRFKITDSTKEVLQITVR